MTSSRSRRLRQRWLDIPIGCDNSITYKELEHKWGMSARSVRREMHELSRVDFGDSFILIRSSHNKGFYRSSNPLEIRQYAAEITSRAKECLEPLAVINKHWG